MRAATSAPTPDCCQPSSIVSARPVFLHGSDDGLGVHRADGAEIDDLGLDAFLGEFFGGLQRVGHAHRPGDDGDVLALAHHARLADRHDIVVELRHFAGVAVEHLVLEEDDGIGIADRGLQEALVVGGRVRRDHLQARNLRVPGRIVLAVLRGDARGGAVRPAEHDGAAHLAAGHIERLGRGVDDLVDRLHGEIEGHELDDRLQARHRRTDADAGKAVLGDRRVDDAAGAEFLQQALRDLVGALIFGDFLAHDEDVGVAAHLFGHRVAQRFADGLRDELGSRRHFRLGLADGGRRGRMMRRRDRRLALADRRFRLGNLLRNARRWRAAAGALARSAALSPSARIIAIGVLTATSAVPSGTRILPSVPSSVASTSIVALSVSISAMTSPDLMVSPSFFSHLARLPFSIVGDSAGIRT